MRVGDALRLGLPDGVTSEVRVVGLSTQTSNPLLSAMPQVWAGRGVVDPMTGAGAGTGRSRLLVL